ncbi:hypothetical protein CH330_02585 [candidate division WOR-3 bacterium JGI_Cruoil_03_51_56]|uniref:Uncharacterized protein n=1 Tax=candidate division WOR-3 bacterium JGI_Cruoil_03_51_56 TaxID=1973747 RepID=A0A235BXL9_UNCW3|nr:MAG: hypothetical protein CH330_02585 [candidate division WOR-3 bacterium JGI_Cruoil_03_51_56]
MRFNWIDLVSIGLVATVGGIQFLRGTRDISQVFYETVFLIAAAVGATRLFAPIHHVMGISGGITFAGTFILLGALGLWLAAFLNRVMAFDMGGFNYLLAFFVGITGGWVVGHIGIRSVYIAFAAKDQNVYMAIRRSWVATQLLYFGAFQELLAILRNARWLNI